MYSHLSGMDNHHHHHTHNLDHHHGHEAMHGSRLVLVILFNTLITVAEFVGGFLSGSLALVSDAWHNLSDVLSLMLGYAGERVSRKEGARHYTFGLRRFEVLAALINSLALLFIGVYIVYEAAQRFLHPSPIRLSIMVPVAFIGLAGNLLSLIVLFRSRHKTLNIRAAFLHLFYDALSSVAVIIAAVALYLTGHLWIDLCISLLIVVMMAWSSLDIISESLRIFLQGAPEEIDPQMVYNDIMSLEGVESIHGLHIWSVSSAEIFLSCHICLNQNNHTSSDGIIRDANSLLEKKYNIYHTTLQIESTLLCRTENGDCCNRKG